MFSARRALALVACVLAVASCSDAPSEPAVEPFDVALVLVSGDDQVGAAGQELPLPLVAEARTPAGDPIPDIVVVFRVVSGGGHAYAGVARTNAQGRAQDYWTLGPDPGQPQLLQVRAVRSGTKRVYATFSATATPPSPSAFTE